MSRADWSKAPEWANWWAVDSTGNAFWYENKPSVYGLRWGQLSEGDYTYSGVCDPTHWRESLEKRPHESADAPARPDPQLSKQVRYRDSEGEDWIDEFARTSTPEEFRGAMRFSIGKYVRRVGRKDAELAEVRKMRDYCQRWEEYLMRAARVIDDSNS